MWRARLGRIPRRSALNNRGVDLDSVLFPRCGEGVEDNDHELIGCSGVRRLWNKIGCGGEKISKGLV